MAASKIADDARSETARVKRVVDGDTIEVEVGFRTEPVRYLGINAPETVHPGRPVEQYGPEAAQANRDLVAYRYVRLENDLTDRDRHGRLLRYVFVEAKGREFFVNAEIVRQGLARSTRFPPDTARQEAIDQAECEAYLAGRGLWKPATSTLPRFQIAIRRIRQLLSRWRSCR